MTKTFLTLTNNHIKNAIQKMDLDYPKIDWQSLAETIRISLRNLDNVIDVNFYTTKESKNANQKHRPVGLGVMGWQDMAQELSISLESEEAVDLSDRLFEFISFIAIDESSNLAIEKGAYESFEGSKWQKGIFPLDSMREHSEQRSLKVNNDFSLTLNWKELKNKVKQTGLRNSQQLAIAPTRSISYLAGTSASIEPWDSNIFTEVGMTGKYQLINEKLVIKLEELGLWTEEIIDKITINDGSIQQIKEIPQEVKDVFKTAWEIHPKWLISANARRQKWIDMGISFNMWLGNNNGKDAERLYMEAWKAGIKTTYYLHSKSSNQSAKVGGSQERQQERELVKTQEQKRKEFELKEEKANSVVKDNNDKVPSFKVTLVDSDLDKIKSKDFLEKEKEATSKIPKSQKEFNQKDLVEEDFATKRLNEELGEIKPGQVCDMTDPNCESCQ
jgi:ribonucleotide reductase alpha subunit